MAVALGQAQVGVPAHLHHRADVDVLLDEQRRGGVPALMDADVTQSGPGLQAFHSSRSVVTGIGAVQPCEHEVEVSQDVAGGPAAVRRAAGPH